jgi:hypothetical protein
VQALRSERGPVSGDPCGVGLAELGHHRGDRLIGIGQQLARRLGLLGRGARSYGLLQLGNQAGDQWCRLPVAAGMHHFPDLFLLAAELVQPQSAHGVSRAAQGNGDRGMPGQGQPQFFERLGPL